MIKKFKISKMEKDAIIAEVVKEIKGKSSKEGWWSKLLDKDNNKVSSSSFYLVSVTLVGLLLLLVPLFVLVIEAWFNHTITTDLNGMAAYIASVAGLFATGGIVKGWISYNDCKKHVAEINSDTTVINDVEEFDAQEEQMIND